MDTVVETQNTLATRWDLVLVAKFSVKGGKHEKDEKNVELLNCDNVVLILWIDKAIELEKLDDTVSFYV